MPPATRSKRSKQPAAAVTSRRSKKTASAASIPDIDTMNSDIQLMKKQIEALTSKTEKIDRIEQSVKGIQGSISTMEALLQTIAGDKAPSGSSVTESEKTTESDELPDVVTKEIEKIIPTGDDEGEVKVSQFQSLSLPLDLNVDSKLREKIHSNQYVDFAGLITVPGEDRIENDGASVYVDKHNNFKVKKKEPKVDTIAKWLDAIHVFISVYTTKHGCLPELLGYVKRIRRLHDIGGNWQFYDVQFRKWISTLPKPTWDVLNYELWDICRGSGQSNFDCVNNRPFPSKPFQGGHKKKHWSGTGQGQTFVKTSFPKGSCHIFQLYGNCRRQGCQFPHECCYCRSASHHGRNCPKKPSA